LPIKLYARSARNLFNARKVCGERDEHRTSNIEHRMKKQRLTLGTLAHFRHFSGLSRLGIQYSIQLGKGGDGILSVGGISLVMGRDIHK
jgi:hypothetical protein